MEKPGFQTEKRQVLGELSHKFKRIGSSDDLENFPSPPPVFQTYQHNVTGEDDDELPPPPPFLNRKQSDVNMPLPPPPPSINPPDYSKLSKKKEDSDRCITPKLLPVTPRGTLPRKSVDESPKRSSVDESAWSARRSIEESAVRGSVADSPRRSVTGSPRRSATDSPRISFTGSPRRSIDETDRGTFTDPPKRSVVDSSRRSITGSPRRSIDETDRGTFTDPPRRSDVDSPRRSVTGSERRSIDESARKESPKNENPYLNQRSDSYAAGLGVKSVIGGARNLSLDHGTSDKIDDTLTAAMSGLMRMQEGPARRRSSVDALKARVVAGDGDLDKDSCYKCKGKIEIGGIGALNRAYHKECFQCTDCGKVLQARFNSMENQPYCDNCYEENAERCTVCEGLIVGDALKSGDKFYHSHCMKCSVCSAELTGTYFTSGKNFICEKDYKASLDACSFCGDLLTSGFYQLDNKNICQKCYKTQLSPCGICGEAVEGKMLKLAEKVFHPDCFNCQMCSKNLAGVSFSQDQDKNIYCSDCFQRKFAAVCSGCKEPIVPAKGENSAERVRVQGQDFHPDCFKCEECGLVFDSRKAGHECFPLNNRFLCKPCNLKQNR